MSDDADYIRERARLNAMLADPERVSMRIARIKESFRPRTHSERVALAAATAYVMAVFKAGGPPPSTQAAEGLARTHGDAFLAIHAWCATHRLPLVDYIDVVCRKFRGKPAYFNTFTSETGLRYWREHTGDVVVPPDMDEYATGLATVKAAMKRMAWAGVSVEDVIATLSGTLPLGYLMESPTAVRLARMGRLYPEHLNATLAAIPDGAPMKGDGA